MAQMNASTGDINRVGSNQWQPGVAAAESAALAGYLERLAVMPLLREAANPPQRMLQ